MTGRGSWSGKEIEHPHPYSSICGSTWLFRCESRILNVSASTRLILRAIIGTRPLPRRIYRIELRKARDMIQDRSEQDRFIHHLEFADTHLRTFLSGL
jgi:hypothetical protein